MHTDPSISDPSQLLGDLHFCRREIERRMLAGRDGWLWRLRARVVRFVLRRAEATHPDSSAAAVDRAREHWLRSHHLLLREPHRLHARVDPAVRRRELRAAGLRWPPDPRGDSSS